MKTFTKFIDLFLKEWLIVISFIGLVITSFYTKHFPNYSIKELEVLFMLLVLFITINGLQKSGLILKIAQTIEKGRFIPLKLVIATFLLSMLITNDIALLAIVPLTLSLNINRKDILIILEALAANSGSALTPIGNPQNLYIYWFYDINPVLFIKTIAPFTLTFFILLSIFSVFIKTNNKLQKENNQIQKIDNKAYIYGVILFINILTVFHILPILSGIIVILFAIVFDQKALKIDYSLLLSFLFFFGITDNLKILLASQLNNFEHIFLFTALISQIMSNVPATLLLAKFTTNWQALLWGANAGGFGSLFGSLANLIAYKMYIRDKNTNNTAKFTIKFLVAGYLSLFISILLYYMIQE